MKIITVHGIRRTKNWYQSLKKLNVWDKTNVDILIFEYGFFTTLSFCLFWHRRRAVKEFLEFYNSNIIEGEVPSLIAHSFGTYIFFKAISKYSSIKFNRVILSGSILSVETKWNHFFEKGQIQYLYNDIGEDDSVVFFSSLIIPSICGSSGKNGFKNIDHYKNRIIQKKNKFEHSDGFYEKHMRSTWVPFLLKEVKKFIYDEEILTNSIIERVYKNIIEKDYKILDAKFNARINADGDYYACYELKIKNNSNESKDYIILSTSADSVASAKSLNFKAFDENGNFLEVEEKDNKKQFKAFLIHFNSPLQPGNELSFSYKFMWPQTISFSGDTDHWNIAICEKVRINLNFINRLVNPRFYIVNNHRVVEELEAEFQLEKDLSYSYSLNLINQNSYDGLILYFKKTTNKKYTPLVKTVVKLINQEQYRVSKCIENHIGQIYDIERSVEKKLTAEKNILNERRKLFNDGFLVILNSKNSVVGYCESIIWNVENFNTFEEIKDFAFDFNVKGKILYVIFLAITENERKKGLATVLLEEIEKVGFKYEVSSIALVARASLEDFYSKRGFKSIKTLTNFVSHRDSSVYMVKSL